MHCETIKLDYDPSLNGGQQPELTTYFLDVYPFSKNKLRPVVLVCPGGGYGHLSDRESEAVALKMNSFGFHAAVLKYSLAPMKFPASLYDVCEAVKWIRSQANQSDSGKKSGKDTDKKFNENPFDNKNPFNIEENAIVVAGFSAGAHLAATLGAYFDKEICTKKFIPAEIKPDALLLCYPVITSGENCHKGSVENVTGGDDSLKDIVSIEKHITSTFPKTFIWHTNKDTSVPAENSLLLAVELRKNKIDFEYHLFNRGEHGMGLSTSETCCDDGSTVKAEKQCEVWPELFKNWFDGLELDGVKNSVKIDEEIVEKENKGAV